jgi:hypothetical protein
MRSPKSAVAFLILALVSLTLIGQQTKTAQTPKPAMDPERLEKAHEGIFATQTDKAAEASRLTKAAAGVLPRPATTAPVTRKNFIDEHTFGRMERDRIPHSPLANDEEFMRRAYLDATGLLPTPEQVLAFVADRDPQKRDKLIDSLIGSDDFVDQWAWFWGDLFRTKITSFHVWTKQWLKVDRPYNEVFYDIATVTMKDHNGLPASGYYYVPTYTATRNLTATDPDNYFLLNRLDWIDEFSIAMGRVFLGINMDCVSCHNGAGHTDSTNLFLTRTTRKQFHQHAAFFGKLRRVIGVSNNLGNTSDGNSIMDDLAPGYNTGNDAPFHTEAEARFPRDGKTYEPAFILTGEKPAPDENPRHAIGRILPNHIQFSRATVNLIWSKLMVVGFVEPYDGFDLDRLDPKNPPPKPWTIQPTNPELLNALAEDFRANNFSIHHLFKTIMKSNSYQLSATYGGEWKESYVPYYARRFVRVLTGPEAADVIAQATGRPYTFSLLGERVGRVKQLSWPGDIGGGSRANGVNENTAVSALMQAFFQTNRDNPPTTGNKPTSVQAMLMMASPVVTNRVSAEGSTRVARLLQLGKTDDQIVEELFLASLSRRPEKDEMEVAKRLIKEDGKAGIENVEWILLNSPEFLLNH